MSLAIVFIQDKSSFSSKSWLEWTERGTDRV